ncbi:MAG: hypothetical protein E7161_04950 [Firmicutes bacterium]|nr:hypothetical protein [Bacillota bacterium]
MKTGAVPKGTLKHIVCCLILLLIFVITITKVDARNESDLTTDATDTSDVVPLRPQLRDNLLQLQILNVEESEYKFYDTPRIIEKNIEYYITENESALTFFSKAFGFDIEFVKEDLRTRAETIGELEPTNIGSLVNKNSELKTFENIEYGIVEYFYDLSRRHPEKINKKVVPYSGDSDYVEKLIIYYTGIYSNVDTSIALSIGAAESGYYKVKYMLKRNNVYGGMSNSGLIHHENIEIGVLKYVRLLSKNYFGKGLTTVNSIGRIYCPRTNEYGQKIASPHWINLVNTAKNKYNNYNYEITIEDIINY